MLYIFSVIRGGKVLKVKKIYVHKLEILWERENITYSRVIMSGNRGFMSKHRAITTLKSL